MRQENCAITGKVRTILIILLLAYYYHQSLRISAYDLELMVANQQNLLSGGLHLLASSYPELYYQQYYNSLITAAGQPVAGTGKVAQGKNERSRSRSPQRRSHKSYVSKSHHSSRE